MRFFIVNTNLIENRDEIILIIYFFNKCETFSKWIKCAQWFSNVITISQPIFHGLSKITSI